MKKFTCVLKVIFGICFLSVSVQGVSKLSNIDWQNLRKIIIYLCSLILIPDIFHDGKNVNLILEQKKKITNHFAIVIY